MFQTVVTFDSVAHAIQLALTPVFLLTGIAGILNVMTGRLARIIDRGRSLTENVGRPDLQMPWLAVELRSLERRRHRASSAITACTSSALTTCVVIAAIFLEVLLGLRLTWLVGAMFMVSTLALVIGLSQFLHEVHLATRTTRIELPPVTGDAS